MASSKVVVICPSSLLSLVKYFLAFYPCINSDVKSSLTVDTPALWTTIKRLPAVPGNTESDSSALWALQKLRHCSNTHGLCPAGKQPSSLPTRVLDLGLPEWPKDPSLVQQYLTANIKLHQTSAGSSSGNYICLSHCWGKTDSMLKTTSSNIQEHLAKINYASLPKTFQDGVVFTRKLRIRYLWIDSLCIIQDDQKDWLQEASNMCQVFHTSYLTLCATIAPDCNHGLFVNRSHDKSQNPRSIKIETGPWEIYARQPLDHSCIPGFWEVRGKSPLLNRGWVYQERLLARRLLHFGPQELIWECATETTCECSLIDSYTPKQIHNQTLHGGSAFKIMARWHQMVEEYSKLDFTFESDRLPALRGLITQFQSRETFKNVAGLWEGSLCFDLLWEARRSKQPRSDKREIPTWSWAVVTGKCGVVSYHDHNVLLPSSIQPLAEIKSISCTWDGMHPTKPGTSGLITLYGHLTPVYRPSQEEIDASPNWEFVPLSTRNSKDPILVSADYEWYAEGPGKVTDRDPLFFFALVERGSHLYCLVLRRRKRLQDTFERIGIIGFYQRGVERSAFGEENLRKKVSINII